MMASTTAVSPQAAKATTEASGPNAPPVSAGEPDSSPRKSPSSLSPEPGTPKRPPSAKFHAACSPIANQSRRVNTKPMPSKTPASKPIMADESVFSPAEAVELVRLQAADLVSIKIMKAGGIAKGREIAAICQAAGIACYGGTMFEGGLAIAAGLHLLASTPNISLGAEFYTSTYVMGVEILETPIHIADGLTTVPTGPGLGVTVNEDAVRRVSVAHYQ